MMHAEAEPEKWALLYRLAARLAVVMLFLIPVQVIIFALFPIPETIDEFFSTFNGNWALGLLHADVLYIINNLIVGVMYLAFYFSLKRRGESLMLIALVLGLIGICAYMASNKAFELLSLSKGFSLAADEAAKNLYRAAGMAVLAEWQGTAFDVYYVLNGIALIIMAFVMLKSPLYGKRTAMIGIAAGILMAIPSTAGKLGLAFSLASLVPWIVFAAMSAKVFLALGRPGEE